MKKKILIFLSAGFLVFGFVLVGTVNAASYQNHNVWGWAWAENIGWLSFNCNNLELPEPRCETSNYGVSLDNSTGKLSGYAWSENIGWISFNDFDGSHAQAQLDFGTNKVSGWARALAAPAAGANSGGWDGWIKLRGIAAGSPYGVTLNPTPSPKEFEGWAWGDMVVGWLSFNCSNRGVCSVTTEEGGPSDYKVMTDINPAPSANNLKTERTNTCGSAPIVKFSWKFDDPGDTQSAYNIQIDDDSNLDEEPLFTLNGGGDNFRDVGLGFNTDYWWRLEVFDSQNASSGWISPAGPFNTGAQWPNPSFIPPVNPPAGVTVTFDDTSQCYPGSVDCEEVSGIDYDWDFGDGTTADTIGDVPHNYSVAGNYTVGLTITDSNGSCSIDGSVGVRFPLPKWKEIFPF